MGIYPDKANSRLSAMRQGPLFGGLGGKKAPPQPPSWRNGVFVAGNNAFGWGFAIPPAVSAPIGVIVDQPYTGGQLISFWEAPDDSRIIVIFSGNVVSDLNGYTFNINGAKLGVVEPPSYSANNNWTFMYLEPHWMIDGEAYIIYRTQV